MSRSGAKAASLVAVLALLLPACMPVIHSHVSTFTQLEGRQTDATYAIMPLPGQRGSREFKTYAARVRIHLEANGFVSRSLDRAEFVVAIAYANDDGRDVLSSYPIIGQSGSSSSRVAGTAQAFRNGTAHSASADRASPDEQERDAAATEDDVPRVLRLDIVRRDSIGFGDLEKVFEGEVVSTGSDGDLYEIVPVMIEALFRDFPGKDGAVRHVAMRTVPSIEELEEQRRHLAEGLQP
jgi:hypothetical protein